VSEIERVPSQPAMGSSEADARATPDGEPSTVRELLSRIDAGWLAFLAAVVRIPGEWMDEHVTEGGWTRKQMLAHITTWHDLTHERLGRLMATGKQVDLRDDNDTINARAARQAVGKTAGEIVKDMEASFGKLRRQVQRLSDDQLQAGDAWAAQVVAGNTYDHYAEHIADLHVPQIAEEPAGRR